MNDQLPCIENEVCCLFGFPSFAIGGTSCHLRRSDLGGANN